jgi:hypothetical protein
MEIEITAALKFENFNFNIIAGKKLVHIRFFCDLLKDKIE